MGRGNRAYSFANGVATGTVCYISHANESFDHGVSVVVPVGAPAEDLERVMDLSRTNGYVAVDFRPLDGDAFDFEIVFHQIQTVGIKRGEE